MSMKDGGKIPLPPNGWSVFGSRGDVSAAVVGAAVGAASALLSDPRPVAALILAALCVRAVPRGPLKTVKRSPWYGIFAASATFYLGSVLTWSALLVVVLLGAVLVLSGGGG